MTDGATAAFGRCAHCGSALVAGVRYPVTTRYDEEGDFALHSFCDAECQGAWLEEEGVADETGDASEDAGA